MRGRCSPMFWSAAALLALAACAPPRGPSPAPVAIEDGAGSFEGDAAQRPVVRTWPVMGAVLQVSVWDADSVRALAAMEAARAAVFRVDSLMSADRAGSEVSSMNRRAGTDTATTLSPWTAEVLDLARSITAALGSELDVTDQWREVRFDRATRRASLPRRGMRLDFDGMAKGFAIDRGLDALRGAGVRRAVVDLGGNFAVLGAAPVGPRWSVGLPNPFVPGEMYAAVQLDSGAVATWGGDPDVPRTRQPAGGIASVSVIAPSGILSDVLSTIFRVTGPEAGCRLAARYPGVDVVWVRAPAAEQREELERDADDGVDPELVVLTDALADRLELLSEEPTNERPTRCSALRGQ
jgi:thiamine biosynthesis lipoprotein